jgi:DNA-binding PadR family transcriptional regulator
MTVSVSPRLVILQALLPGPKHALDLAAEVARRTNDRIKLTDQQTYFALRDLESKGMLTSEQQGTGRAQKRLFKLTMTGRLEAVEEREALRLLLGFGHTR